MHNMGGAIHNFLWDILLFHIMENFCRGTLPCFTKFLVSKSLMDKRVSTLPVENFLSHSTKTFPRGRHLCCRKFVVSENFRDKRGQGIKIFHQFFLSDSAETILGGLLCFRKLLMSKNLTDEKGVLLYSVEKVLSHSVNKLRWGIFLNKG